MSKKENPQKKSSGKLNEKIVQLMSLSFGILLLYLDLTGKLNKPVPIEIYMLLLGGFFSGYSLSNFLEKLKK